ncbi:hypothetical protein ES703_35579 [subsurface metagenome]
MKLLTILYDDSKDLSAFVDAMEVIVTGTDGSVTVEGGKIFAESRIPNPEEDKHRHLTKGETGPPVAEE